MSNPKSKIPDPPSGALCRLLFEAAADALLVIHQGRIIDSNDSAAALFGCPLETLLGQTVQDISFSTQPDDRNPNELLQEKIEALEDSHSQRFEWLYRRSDGAASYAEVSLSRIVFEGEVYIQASIRDVSHYKEAVAQLKQEISERKQVVQDLREREAQYKATLDNVPVAIFTKDKDGFYTSINANTLRYWFQNPLGHTDIELLEPEIGQALRANDMEVMRTRKELALEETVHTPEGTKVVLSRKLPTYDTDGQVNGILGISVDITDRKELEQEIQDSFKRRGRQTQLSTWVAQEAAAVTDLDQFFQDVVTQVKEQLDYYHVQLYRFNPKLERLNLIAGDGDLGRQILAEDIWFRLGEGIVGETAATNVPVTWTDVADIPSYQFHPLLSETKGILAVPIFLGEPTVVTSGQLLGVLVVLSNLDNRLSHEDQLVLEGVAGQIAATIENTRLLEEANIFRQFVEVSGQGMGFTTIEGNVVFLNPTFAQILREPTPENSIGKPIFPYFPEETLPKLQNEVLPTVIEKGSWVGELPLRTIQGEYVPAIQHYSLIRDKDGNPQYITNVSTDITERKKAEAELEASVQELNALQRLMRREGWQTFQTSQAEAAQGYLFDQMKVQPLTRAEAGNSEAHLDLLSQSSPGNGHSSVKPVAIRGEVIGQIGIYGDAAEQPLTSDDQEFLDTIAAELAEALEQARLLEQIQKRAVELEAVAQVSTVASTTLEVDKLLQTVVDLTKAQFGLYHAHIYLLNDTGNELILGAGADEVGRQMVREAWHISADHPHSLVARAARAQKGIIANDVHKEPDFLPNPNLPETRSELAVPMVVGNKLLGVLDVQASVVNRFTGDDVQIMTTLTAQVAVALQNASLIQQTQIALAETEQLYDISGTLSSATTLDEVLQTVVSHALTTEISNAALMAIDLDAEDRPEWVEIIAVWDRLGTSIMPLGSRFYLPEFPIAHLWIENPNEPMLISDILADERVDSAAQAIYQQASALATVNLPLRLGSRWIGLVSLNWATPQEFTDRDERLYQAIASQVAVVVNNLLQIQRTQVALTEVEAIQRRYTVQSWEAYRAKQTVPGYEQQGDQLGPLNTDRLPLEIGQAVGQKQATVISAPPRLIGGDANENDGLDLSPTNTPARSSLIAPLTVRDQVVGVVGLQEMERHREWSPEEIALVETIAEQMALAAESLRLIDETQQRAAREQRVNEIGEKIQGAQSLEEALHIAIKEVGRSLQSPQTTVRLDVE